VRGSRPAELLEAARGGDRRALGRLLSLAERGGPEARETAEAVHPRTGRAYTVGVTGPPGAGKSTLVDGLLRVVRGTGAEAAVLAVDPSSPLSGGAVLGDRVRMQGHALDPGVFIRSMATRGHHGGLALAVPRAVGVLDAAGFPWVLVETAGVGQVEVAIAGAADTTVLVLNPGSGDSVQAAKAGVLEVADVLVVNRADRPGVEELERDLHQMLALGPPGRDGPAGGGEMQGSEVWLPPVVRTVGTTGAGIDLLWSAVVGHREHLEASGALARRRRRRDEGEVAQLVACRLALQAAELVAAPAFALAVDQVVARRLDPYGAADQVLAAGGREAGGQGLGHDQGRGHEQGRG